MAILRPNNDAVVHRGHREAQRALQLWLHYVRCKKQAVVKDWRGCEELEPERLPLADRVNRGDFGENVISICGDKPTLDSLDQVKQKCFSYNVGQDDTKPLISSINGHVYTYFYNPATTLTYSEFCQCLIELKQQTDTLYEDNQATSPYQRDLELKNCHYAFIYAGFGKLEGDIDTGVSPEEPPEAIAAVIELLTAIEKQELSSSSMRQKIISALTNAENMYNRVAKIHSLPTLTRPPGA